MGLNIVTIIHIHGAKAIFYYFVFTKTPNPSNVKYNLVYLNKCSPRKIQGLYGTTVSTVYSMGGTHCGNSSYLSRYSYFPSILLLPIQQI